MQLHNLKPAPGSRKKRRIVGRGEGSTLGQTCGKGQKGQKSRSGDTIMVGFEGGQTPLVRRIPKRGFNNVNKIYYEAINLVSIEANFENGQEVSNKTLFEKGLLKKLDTPFKVLGVGKISKTLKFVSAKFSKSASDAVKKSGGTVA